MATIGPGLLTVAVSKKDSATWSKTILVNTYRILDMELNSSGLCEFWYDMALPFPKNPAVKLTCTSYTVRNLDYAINKADPNQPRINIHIMRERRPGHSEVVRDKIVKISTSQIVYGYDNATAVPNTGSYIWITRGNELVRLETSHSILDLVRSSSKSASLSRSPMS